MRMNKSISLALFYDFDNIVRIFALRSLYYFSCSFFCCMTRKEHNGIWLVLQQM